MTEKKTFYDLCYEDINGQLVSFDKYRNKVCLVVNTAGKCGLAQKNMEFLSRLSKEHVDLRVLLFPSAINRFINQEHDTPEKIMEEMEKYGGNFEVFKFSNINDNNSNKVFSYLRRGFFSYIKWNFTKFLIDRRGQMVKRYSPIDGLDKVEKTVVGLLKEDSGQEAGQ